MKRPAFQFYPADWRKDAALQSCSLQARGLWHEMLCIMHECSPYGHLYAGPVPMSLAQLGRLVGESEKTIRALVDELELSGVFSRSDQGAIYSRRMVKDERIRNIRAQAGKLGGNPDLLGKKVNQTDNHVPKQSSNQEPTPSSSSSSSSSKQQQREPATPPVADATSASVTSVFDHWRAVMNHPGAKLDDKRKKLIRARLNDGYSEKQLLSAIDGCKASPFHMGKNANNTVYDGLDLILRDGSKVDGFLAIATGKPVVEAAVSPESWK